MNFFTNLLNAIAQGLGLAKQSLDPEVIRQAKLREIDANLAAQRKKRDDLIWEKITPDNEVQHSLDLADVCDNIVRLRASRATYER